MKHHNYFVYITTNPGKTVFYVGVTNDLQTRLSQHKANKGNPSTFGGKYYCYYLIYYERFCNINHAIEREKEFKLMNRETKLALVREMNPKLNFLNIQE